MFAKKFRFSFKKGLPKNAISSPLFTLRYGQSPVFRLQTAIVVSKKVDKRAAVRNKVKRRFSHALSSVMSSSPVSLTLVFFLKRESVDKTKEDFEKEIQNILKRGTII